MKEITLYRSAFKDEVNGHICNEFDTILDELGIKDHTVDEVTIKYDEVPRAL